jgi:hypothetical protein
MACMPNDAYLMVSGFEMLSGDDIFVYALDTTTLDFAWVKYFETYMVYNLYYYMRTGVDDVRLMAWDD